jgi:hypothetical protein
VKLAAAAVAAAGMALASRAGAVEREHHLGLDLGGSMLVLNDKTDLGGGAGAHWAYGLTDAFNVMAEGAWSLVSIGEKVQSTSTPRTRPGSVANGDVGLAYVLDVGQWVPYAGALAGASALTGGTVSKTKILPDLVTALGLDYRFGRSWAAGLAFRQHFFVTEISTYPSFTQVCARFEYTWGW